MRKIGRFVVLSSLVMGLGACSWMDSKSMSPDEFEVVGRRPLVVPPDNNMRPPRPGAPRPQSIDPAQRALDALFPGRGLKAPAAPSNGEMALLQQIGGADTDVRSTMWQKDPNVVKKSLLLADILHAEERQHRPDNVKVTRVASNSQ